jgi:hypothetical protein
VFDRAYLDYKKFDSYCENGTLFVTRSKGNAIIEIHQELPVDANGPIEKDCIVYLGNKKHLQDETPPSDDCHQGHRG